MARSGLPLSYAGIIRFRYRGWRVSPLSRPMASTPSGAMRLLRLFTSLLPRIVPGGAARVNGYCSAMWNTIAPAHMFHRFVVEHDYAPSVYYP